MTFASASQFHVFLPWGQRPFSIVSYSVLNVKALVGAFTQEKALVGAFSAFVKTLWTFVSSFSTDRGGGVDQEGCEGCVGGVDLALVRLQHPVVAGGGEAGLHQGVAGHCLLSLPGHGPGHTRVLCIIVSQILGKTFSIF